MVALHAGERFPNCSPVPDAGDQQRGDQITFERTEDAKLVKHILTLPDIWPHVGDDFAGTREEFVPNMDARIWYVLVFDGNRLVGMACFVPRSEIRWEVHLSLFRVHRPKGDDILRGAFAWLFEHTSAQRIIAEIPACNRLAVKLAERTMSPMGTDEKAFMKRGILQDSKLFGIGKSERQCPAS